MGRDIEQPALPSDGNLGKTGDFAHHAVMGHKQKPPAPLGHDHAAIGQEAEGPGVVQAAGNPHEGEIGLL